MITDISSYHFVSNLSGNVLINGGIMPWRDVHYTAQSSPPEDDPKCLRGEDVAFLTEAAARL